MKMSNNPAINEVISKQYLRSILDRSFFLLIVVTWPHLMFLAHQRERKQMIQKHQKTIQRKQVL